MGWFADPQGPVFRDLKWLSCDSTAQPLGALSRPPSNLVCLLLKPWVGKSRRIWGRERKKETWLDKKRWRQNSTKAPDTLLRGRFDALEDQASQEEAGPCLSFRQK